MGFQPMVMRLRDTSNPDLSGLESQERSELLLWCLPQLAPRLFCPLADSPRPPENATHGLEALTLASSGKFDLVVMDLDLPGLDGFEIARLLRAQGVSAPIVALTARADSEVEGQARAAGMAGFMRKPITGDMLSSAVDRHARRSGTETALA